MTSLLATATTSLFDLVSDAAIIVDASGRIHHWNLAATRLYGWSVDEVIDRPIAAIAPFPFRTPTLPTETIAAMHQRRDGSSLAVQITVQPLTDGTGSPAGALALVHQSTLPTPAPAAWDAPRASTATDETQLADPATHRHVPPLAALTNLLAQVPFGLALLDTELRFQYLNDVLADINGPPAAAHLGHTLREILPALAPALEPLYQQVLSSGEPLLDIEIVGSTPAAPQETRTWWASYVPVRDDAGVCIGVGAVVRDVTRQRELEQTLHRQRVELRAILETMHEGVVAAYPDGRIAHINPAALTMRDLDPDQPPANVQSLVDQIAYQAIDGDGQPLPRDQLPIHRVLRGERFVGLELCLRSQHDGAVCWQSLNGAPVYDRDGALIMGVLTGQDITQRRHDETTLRQQMAMLDHAPILVRDAASRIVAWNQGAERLYGWTAAEALGRISHELFQTRFPTSQADVHAELLATGRWAGELTHHRCDGGEIVVASLWILFRDTIGAPTHILEVNNDITAARRAEVALRANQQQLQHLIDNTDGALWSMDADFRLLVGNRLFHEQVRAVTGRDIAAGDSLLLPELPADLLAERRQIYGRALAGDTFTLERLSHVVDPPRMLEEHYRPIRESDGTITGVVVFMRDVTAARRLAQERQDLERKLAAVLDLLPVGVAILDVDGAVVYMNPAQRHIARLDASRVPTPLQPDRQYLRPDGTVRPLDEFATTRALREQQPVADVETGIVTEAGDRIWTRVSATPVDLAGWRVVAVMRDITEQHLAHQALRQEREQLAAILHTMHEGLIAVYPDGRIALMNPAAARTRDLDPARLPTRLLELAQTGHQILDASGRVVPIAELPLHRVLRGERFTSAELCQRSPDGQEQWHLVNGTPVYGDDGALLLGVITSKDITERRRDEAALAAHAEMLSRTNGELTRALTLKDEFLAMITHELRTPLNVVLGYAEALAEEVYGPVTSRQQQTLERIRRSGRHLLGILSDILDLTGLSAGGVTLTPEALDIDVVCRTALPFVEQRARDQGITLLRSVAVGIEGVRADSRRLTQILVNLLDNAVKFTPAGGTVGLEVTVDEAREQIHFTVWDTGIGIATADVGRLFQPFTQVDGRLSRAYEGVGLGLTLVRRLVDLHGGSVTLTSEPGQGSRFTVTLPWTAADNDRAPRAEPERAPQAPTWRQPPHVLVVDDDEATVTLYAERLAALGCTVTTARTGIEALRRVREHVPDIVVLDIQLPELHGIGVLERLRADPATALLPVLAVTALAMPGDRERTLAAGATVYLAKPVSLHTLVETIKQIRHSGALEET